MREHIILSEGNKRCCWDFETVILLITTIIIPAYTCPQWSSGRVLAWRVGGRGFSTRSNQ